MADRKWNDELAESLLDPARYRHGRLQKLRAATSLASALENHSSDPYVHVLRSLHSAGVPLALRQGNGTEGTVGHRCMVLTRGDKYDNELCLHGQRNKGVVREVYVVRSKPGGPHPDRVRLVQSLADQLGLTVNHKSDRHCVVSPPAGMDKDEWHRAVVTFVLRWGQEQGFSWPTVTRATLTWHAVDRDDGTANAAETPRTRAARTEDSMGMVADDDGEGGEGGASGGQGFPSSPEVRDAIEEHAMKEARAYFTSSGYEVEDTSKTKPYDLCARKDGTELYVEVKGTSTSGDQVTLTKNEVEHARRHSDRSVLFVVHGIGDGEDVPKATGGKQRVLWPWTVDDGKLTALSYRYTLPEGLPEEG